MTEMIPPYLTSALWFGAAACLILLLLVIFGYHLYQRSRFRAITRDGASVAQLAARKEMLEADVHELRTWMAEHRAEQQKLEAERHQQELTRANLVQLEEQLAAKRNESQLMLSRVAELDIMLEKRRQLHARLDADIRSLEEQRQALAPMEKYAQDLRIELDQGRARLAQMAQEEVRWQSLQTQADLLRQEMQQLSRDIEPMREERTKLRQFIEQARQATAVKNEQLQEQKLLLRQLEGEIAKLELRKNSLEAEADAAHKALGNIRQDLEELRSAKKLSEDKAIHARQEAMAEQTQLEMLLQRREEHGNEVAALEARKAVLTRELEILAARANLEAQQAAAAAEMTDLRPRKKRALPKPRPRAESKGRPLANSPSSEK